MLKITIGGVMGALAIFGVTFGISLFVVSDDLCIDAVHPPTCLEKLHQSAPFMIIGFPIILSLIALILHSRIDTKYSEENDKLEGAN